MKLLNVGFGNFISAERLICVSNPDSAPIKRLMQDARDRGTLIDATCGKKTKSVIVMDSDHVVLSAVAPSSLSGRLKDNDDDAVSDVEITEEDGKESL